MTYDEFQELCSREWRRCQGRVTEIRLSEESIAELGATVPKMWSYTLPLNTIARLLNETTGGYVILTTPKEEAVVERPPITQIASTYTVPIEVETL